MKGLLPPVEVSRSLLLALVAAGALISVASSGRLSNFAGGFAVGAGSVFLLSWFKRHRGTGQAGEDGGGP